MALIHCQQRPEALACVGRRGRHGPGIEIQNRHRSKHVAVEAHDGLLVDRDQTTVVRELPEAASNAGVVAKGQDGFDANEVVGGDKNSGGCGHGRHVSSFANS